MKALALVMAGGSGLRMQRSRIETPKPLVPVRGVPLVERNLLALLGHGAREIVVSVPSSGDEVGAFVRTRCQELTAAAGARLHVLPEKEPRGNIGCASELPRDRPVLVVFADNLSDIDLADLVDRHIAQDAAMTVATHDWTYRIPFGEIVESNGRVLAYREKPEQCVRVSSGSFVLGAAALEAIPLHEACGSSDLTQLLLSREALVRSYAHASRWIDVNDAAAVHAAEKLVASSPETLECFWGAADRYVATLLVTHGNMLLVEAAANPLPPGVGLDPAQPRGARERAAAWLREKGIDVDRLRDLGPLDHLDTPQGVVTRHRVFGAAATSPSSRGTYGHWIGRDQLERSPEWSHLLRRLVSLLGWPE